MGVAGGWLDGRCLVQGQGNGATPEAAVSNSIMTVGQRRDLGGTGGTLEDGWYIWKTTPEGNDLTMNFRAPLPELQEGSQVIGGC